VDQIDRIKTAYDEERTELEKRVRMLVEEVNEERQMRKEAESQQSKRNKNLDELSASLQSLRQQNSQVPT
jgi:uncharacterized coiled-coil DUF342 family protein